MNGIRGVPLDIDVKGLYVEHLLELKAYLQRPPSNVIVVGSIENKPDFATRN
jgi:hypothetical protein